MGRKSPSMGNFLLKIPHSLFGNQDCTRVKPCRYSEDYNVEAMTPEQAQGFQDICFPYFPKSEIMYS